MICKSCAFKGESKDFTQGGIYVCPKCKSMNIRLEKATSPSQAVPMSSLPKNGNPPAAKPGPAKTEGNPPPPKRVVEIVSKPDTEILPVPPSGKFTRKYGEISIRVWLTGDKNDPNAGAEATIDVDPTLPFEILMVACEQLMTFTAQKSKAGFEKALELLAEGAMTNRGRMVKK